MKAVTVIEADDGARYVVHTTGIESSAVCDLLHEGIAAIVTGEIRRLTDPTRRPTDPGAGGIAGPATTATPAPVPEHTNGQMEDRSPD